jgi:molybdenum cofactor sulfurtransferase
LKTGCFCNPGACQASLNLSKDDILNNFNKGHVCWDDNDIIDNKPTGSIRISFGYISRKEDVESFLKFVEKYIIEKEKKKQNSSIDSKKKLSNIILYPIKSCQGS